MENKNERLIRLSEWKNRIIIECDSLARNKNLNLDLDFYVFQTSVTLDPPILIIGANPGGYKPYSEFLDSNNVKIKSVDALGYAINQFLENPEWHSNSLISLFSSAKLRQMFEKSVVTNFVYFNTVNFSNFKKRKGSKDAIKFCKESNKELIEILKPKNIILMGNISLDGLKFLFDRPMVSVLTVDEGVNGSSLVRQTAINGIPTFWIHHPSMNKKFNTDPYLTLKRMKLENLLKD
ncbi:MAG: hypothetical protein PHQ26_02470 [Bacteroidales bacterium]|nr:hypothetical protein [Bacteroidales bacterium]MDD4770333.1 hypothetical protein [Bacteroidales bacterium]